MAVHRCLLCGEPVVAGTGFVALGYYYHDYCVPFKEVEEKQRCFYCHKILRKGNTALSLADIGMGGRDDRVCTKCAHKHFAEERAR